MQGNQRNKGINDLIAMLPRWLMSDFTLLKRSESRITNHLHFLVPPPRAECKPSEVCSSSFPVRAPELSWASHRFCFYLHLKSENVIQDFMSAGQRARERARQQRSSLMGLRNLASMGPNMHLWKNTPEWKSPLCQMFQQISSPRLLMPFPDAPSTDWSNASREYWRQNS